MLDAKHHTELEKPSERNFGAVFTIVFILVAFWSLLTAGTSHWIFFALAVLLLITTWLKPIWLSKPNHYWYKLGIVLGAIIAPIIMALVFLLTIVPIGLIAKLLSKDMLDQSLDPSASTYWKTRNEPMQSFDKQY